jgi:NTE family protein
VSGAGQLPAGGAAHPLAQRLAELQRSLPGVADRALVDLVNGLQVDGDVLRFRRQRGLLGRVLDGVTGADRARALLVQENLAAGQHALLDWVRELTGAVSLTQVGLMAAQESLLEARWAVRGLGERVGGVEDALAALGAHLEDRVDALQAEVWRLRGRVEAEAELDRRVAAWASGRTYPGLPWVVAAALLAREVFSGAVGAYEAHAGDGGAFREHLVDRVLAHVRPRDGFFALADVLDGAGRELTGEAGALAPDLLDTRALPWRRTRAMPNLFALGTALELATLPAEVRPPRPGSVALALCGARVAALPRTSDPRSLLTAIVDETADDCAALLARRERHDAPPSPPPSLPPSIPSALPSVRTRAVHPAVPPRARMEGAEGLDGISEGPDEDPEPAGGIGLVLAGGGARGAYHVGALRYLAEAGFAPTIVAGTSIGALNGAVIACCPALSDGVARLEAVWDELARADLLRGSPRGMARIARNMASAGLPRFTQWLNELLLQGALPGEETAFFDPAPLDALLRASVHAPTLRAGLELWVAAFPSLRVPGLSYGALGVLVDAWRAASGVRADWFRLQDCETDEMAYQVLLASAAIPFVFPRRQVDGRAYVDGGLADNVPLGALAARGCRDVVVIHLSNGAAWSRHRFPDQRVIEIRPRASVYPTDLPLPGAVSSLLDFRAERIHQLKEQGYGDARATLEPLLETLRLHAGQRRVWQAMVASTAHLLADPPLA